MLDLLEEVHLLEDFALGEVVLHVTLLNRLDRNILASQFVHAECDLAEHTLAYQFDELLEFEGGGWQLIILRYVALDVSDQFITFLQHRVIDLQDRLLHGLLLWQ